MVPSAAGSVGWEAVVIRRAWRAAAWSSSRTASRALPDRSPASAPARTAAALRAASGVRVNPASAASVAKIAASCPAV